MQTQWRGLILSVSVFKIKSSLHFSQPLFFPQQIKAALQEQVCILSVGAQYPDDSTVDI